MKRRDVEELIVDLAIHHALMYGTTPAAVLGSIVGNVALRPEEWSDMSEHYRQELRITEP
jgi:hypothetical protein